MADKKYKDKLFKTNLDVSEDLIPLFTTKDRKRNFISSECDYSVFFDENGDTYLDHARNAYLKHEFMDQPLELDNSKRFFCLTSVIMKNESYKKAIIDNKSFKEKYWPGLSSLVFHSREIRRKEGPFQILNEEIIGELSLYIEHQDFTIIYCIIDKCELIGIYNQPLPPYYLAIGFILERLLHRSNFPCSSKFELVLESRGHKEDNALLRAILGLIIEKNYKDRIRGVYFNRKTDNSHLPEVGLELADLCSYPLYSCYCNKKVGRDYEVIKRKVHPYGRKIFP